MWRVVAVTLHCAADTGESHHITWSNDNDKDLADLLQIILFEMHEKLHAAEPPAPPAIRSPYPLRRTRRQSVPPGKEQ